jgi:hypothetical protein
VKAIEDMFDRTSTKHAPWHAIQSNHKPAARVEAIKTIVGCLSEGIDKKEPPIDKRILEVARKEFGDMPLVERRASRGNRS